MQHFSMFGFVDAGWIDQFMLWSVASMAAVLVLVSVVSALDLILESESEADPG